MAPGCQYMEGYDCMTDTSFIPDTTIFVSITVAIVTIYDICLRTVTHHVRIWHLFLIGRL